MQRLFPAVIFLDSASRLLLVLLALSAACTGDDDGQGASRSATYGSSGSSVVAPGFVGLESASTGVVATSGLGASGAAACESGACSEVSPSVDGCSDTLVTGLSLSEISVYQAIKVTVMASQTSLPRGQRQADIVQGRDALFRVHVAPQVGYAPREVSARLILNSASGAQQFTTRLAPSGPSTDDKADNAFLIKVPADAIRADTSYAVSLVECEQATPIGNTQAARYPADGFVPLEARATGPLHVHLVPLDTGGAIADTSPATLDIYRRRLMAVYPITKVEFTVGAPLKSSASSMCNHLPAIASRRGADAAPADLYYYGLTPGLSGGQSGCSNAVQNANSSGKTAVGWQTITDPDMGERGASTMAHELGHSHGRLHAPCNVQDPDPNYPYAQADIGVWGYDARTGSFMSPTHKDMMSYCPNPDRAQAWLSDYTYRAILERVAAVNALVGTRSFAKGATERSWRQLVVDHTGEHWSEYPLVVEGAPEGDLLSAIVRRADGSTTEVDVYKQELEDGMSEHPYLLLAPEPELDWRSLELPGLLAAHAF